VAGFVTSDGWVVDTTGLNPVTFRGLTPDSYRVAVFHRNHLAIMTDSLVDFTSGPVTHDFTLSQSAAHTTGPNPMKSLPNNRFGMFAGDGVPDGVVQALDFNLYLLEIIGGAAGYNPGDYDMDGDTQLPDFNLHVANTVAGASSQVP
jgi:hypothetical protein